MLKSCVQAFKWDATIWRCRHLSDSTVQQALLIWYELSQMGSSAKMLQRPNEGITGAQSAIVRAAGA